MRAAGYRLYWLSNQQPEGSHGDSQVSFLFRAADERVFINKRGWTDGVSLDGELLPRLKDVLSDGVEKRFIVVHLIGTHTAYDDVTRPTRRKLAQNQRKGEPKDLTKRHRR